ncbi:TssA family type VI secretion system protein [Vibrio profundum]|uniref:TssA family type VI secretion system protein n=1 Tax=Vibrio profundum TaxID=2910247 RepID=UPI003D12268A
MLDIYKLGINGFKGENPAGVNISNVVESEMVLAEINKLNMIEKGPDEVSWKLINDEIISLLSKHGKHFQFSAYLAVARCELNGLAGLAEGAELLKELTINFWDSAYPPKKRMRGRMNAIQWWYDWVNRWVENLVQNNKPCSAEQVEQAAEQVQALERALVAQYDDAPVMRGLLNHIQRIPIAPQLIQQTVVTNSDSLVDYASVDYPPENNSVGVTATDVIEDSCGIEGSCENESQATCGVQKTLQVTNASRKYAAVEHTSKNGAVPEVVANEESDSPVNSSEPELARSHTTEVGMAEASTVEASRVEADATGVMSQEDSELSVEKLNRSAFDCLCLSAEKLFKQDQSQPLSYRFRRMAAWGGWIELPSHQNRKTKVAPPSRQDIKLIESAKATGDLAVWLTACEKRVVTQPYWLELSYQVWQILDQLGDQYCSAKQEVEYAAAQVVLRFPELVGLFFRDGSPFVSVAAEGWLSGLQKSESQEQNDHLSEIETQVTRLLNTNEFELAVEVLTRSQVGESAQNRFRLKIRIAQIFQRAGYEPLALMQIDACLKQVTEHGLDLWLPELAMASYRVAYECHLTLNQEQLAQEYLAKITAIDPSVAIGYLRSAH